MIKVNFSGELRNVTKKEFVRRNGEKGADCKILVECGVYSHTLPCTEKVVEMFESGALVKGSTYEFEAVYQPRFQFNNFVVQNVG